MMLLASDWRIQMGKDTNKSKTEAQKPKTEAKKTEAKASKPTKVVEIYNPTVALMMSEANTAMKKKATVIIPFDIFKSDKVWNEDWNPGRRGANDHLSLYTEIVEVGMKTNPLLNFRGPRSKFDELVKANHNKDLIDLLNGLQGYLRRRCTIIAEKQDKPAFEKHWSKGITVDIVYNMTPEQELYLARDHNTITRSRVAVIEQAIDMFQCGRSEVDVCLTLWDELASHWRPVTPEQMVKILAHSDLKGQASEMKKVRRGVMQQLHYLASNLPLYALEAAYRSEKGEDGPKIKLGDAIDLNKANGEGSQQTPTGSFTELFQQKVEQYGKKKASTTRTTAEMKEFFGRLGSQTMEAVRMFYFKEADINFMEIDSQLCDNEGADNIVSPYFEMTKASKQARQDAANAA